MTKNRIMLIAGIAGTLLLLATGAYFATGGFTRPLVLSISVQPAGTGAARAEAAAVAPLAPASGMMYDLGSKVVNLADPGGYRYLRVSIVLEVDPNAGGYAAFTGEEKKKVEQALREKIALHRPAIDDTVVGVLSNKAFGDIFNLSGKENLKTELCKAINEQLDGLKIIRIYFTDFVIQ